MAARLDWLTPLAEEWRDLAMFAARYYQRCLGEVMLPSLPPSLREPEGWPRLAQRARAEAYQVVPARIPALLDAVPVRARSVRALAQGLADRAEGHVKGR
ncbi:hypothetical protein AWV80_07645 [Cupriavidus sp. UYMU48A]|nr:hypothetical protein AWV80_07645 [Cupriavidus sp. UYMU48A]